MSVSAIFGAKVAVVSPNPSKRAITGVFYGGIKRVATPKVDDGYGDNIGLMIECSSRPQKKATAHHRKTRPRKTQQWDRNRGPTVYPPLPTLPPEWTLVVEDSSSPPPPPATE